MNHTEALGVARPPVRQGESPWSDDELEAVRGELAKDVDQLQFEIETTDEAVRAVRRGDCALDAAEGDGKQAYFFPRLGRNPLDERFARLPAGSTVRIAASHFADLRIAKRLAKLARQGSRVEVLTHHTQRRSPGEVIEFLRSHGVRTYRYEHPDELPMHAKFILAEGPSGSWSAVGSYNLNWNSRLLNQELLVFSNDPQLWHALDMRWEAILSEPWCQD